MFHHLWRNCPKGNFCKKCYNIRLSFRSVIRQYRLISRGSDEKNCLKSHFRRSHTPAVCAYVTVGASVYISHTEISGHCPFNVDIFQTWISNCFLVCRRDVFPFWNAVLAFSPHCTLNATPLSPLHLPYKGRSCARRHDHTTHVQRCLLHFLKSFFSLIIEYSTVHLR